MKKQIHIFSAHAIITIVLLTFVACAPASIPPPQVQVTNPHMTNNGVCYTPSSVGVEQIALTPQIYITWYQNSPKEDNVYISIKGPNGNTIYKADYKSQYTGGISLCRKILLYSQVPPSPTPTPDPYLNVMPPPLGQLTSNVEYETTFQIGSELAPVSASVKWKIQ